VPCALPLKLIQPFRWSRLFWTDVVIFDGIVSCLRIYAPEEMMAMTNAVGGKAFSWEAGFEYPPRSAIPTPYLIGIARPNRRSTA
jgi:hypothetical protein